MSLAARIADQIETRAPFEDCSAELPDLAAAYAAQDAVRAILGPKLGGVGGRKIAWNGPGQWDALGLPGPGVAPVYADLILAAPATLQAADFSAFTFEPEIAARLGAPIPPRAAPWTQEDVAPFIDRLLPAFEIMDRRTDGNPPPYAAVANGVFNRGLALGGPGIAPADLDLSALRSHVELNGETILDKISAAPMHPFEAIARIATHASARGETLAAGEILLCGTHLPPRLHRGPGALRFACGPLGEVSLTLA